MFSEKQKMLLRAVDANQDLISTAEQYIWRHPETGYKEWQTSAYLEKIFEDLGYTLVKAGSIPGFFTDLQTGRPGPCILIMGELDALAAPNHPESVAGNAHACGHHAQCAAMAGLAAALKAPGALDGLCGTIRLMIVPAEELIEIAYRESLRQEGKIRYYGGKVEFMYRGYLNGVDLAFMLHTSNNDEFDFACNVGGNGCVAKRVIYSGTAAHAGGSPHLGVNALYAAQIGMQAVNALRETFQDDDHIRVHPILTAGGSSVNIIPADVRLESYVRGAAMSSIKDANRKVNRALAAGAAALGAKMQIVDRPGYAPLNNDKNLMALAKDCMEMLVGAKRVDFNRGWGTGSTDMGDLSCVMPVIHPYVSGATGTGHGIDYKIQDVGRACLNSAKAQILMVEALLQEDAKKARVIINESKPAYPSFEAYFAAVDQLACDLDAVTYQEDGSILIRI